MGWTVDYLWAYLGRTGTPTPIQVDTMERALADLLSQMQRYTRRCLVPCVVQDRFHSWSNILQLAQAPVVSLTQVTVGGVPLDANTLWVDVNRGWIEYHGADSFGCVPFGLSYGGDVQVDYVAGFDPLPADLETLLLRHLSATMPPEGTAMGVAPTAAVKAVTLEGVGSVTYGGQGTAAGVSLAPGADPGSLAVVDRYRDYSAPLTRGRHTRVGAIVQPLVIRPDQLAEVTTPTSLDEPHATLSDDLAGLPPHAAPWTFTPVP